MLRDDFGVGRGDRVVMFSMNRVEFIEVQFACARLGAVFVPVNWRLTVHELDYIVNDAVATVLCADPEFGEASIAEPKCNLCRERRVVRRGRSSRTACRFGTR